MSSFPDIVRHQTLIDEIHRRFSFSQSDHVDGVAYLLDWRHALNHGHRISHTNYQFRPSGVFAQSMGTAGEFADDLTLDHLSTIESASDHLESLSYREMMKLLVSTYPYIILDNYKPVNLEYWAIHYKQSNLFSNE